MSAKKQLMSITNQYNVTLGHWDSKTKAVRHSSDDTLFGRVSADFGGLHFFIYDEKEDPNKIDKFMGSRNQIENIRS